MKNAFYLILKLFPFSRAFLEIFKIYHDFLAMQKKRPD